MPSPTLPSMREPAAEAVACPSCGAIMGARYCPECGERRVRDGELSLRRFLADAVRELLGGSGSRLWRSLRLLGVRPGALTAEYVAGRRRPYLKPIQIFLLANLVYFFVQPLTIYTGYNSTLDSQVSRQNYSDAFRLDQVVGARAAAAGLDRDTYEQLYNLQSANYARTLIILMVPMLAVMLAGFLAFRRRPFAQHLVFALHFYAWDLLYMSALFLFAWGGFLAWVRATFPAVPEAVAGAPGVLRYGWVALIEFPTIPFTLAYLYLATRRVYGLSRLSAALLALVLIPILFCITLVYRFTLFWITVLTV